MSSYHNVGIGLGQLVKIEMSKALDERAEFPHAMNRIAQETFEGFFTELTTESERCFAMSLLARVVSRLACELGIDAPSGDLH